MWAAELLTWGATYLGSKRWRYELGSHCIGHSQSAATMNVYTHVAQDTPT
ncbi:hypothetical protein SUDANB38_01611 [Streptomyces sp. enrichment culture]